MILVVDNYDSFTFNLVQYLGEMGAEPRVERNDAITPEEALALGPRGVVLSPGPKDPASTEPANRMVRELRGRVPLLGVCLGHQCIAHVHGAAIRRAGRLMHGKTSMIIHSGKAIFRGLTNPFQATRYHSLIVDRDTLPPELEVTAWTAEGEVMGIQHRELPVWGVQFHPESILTVEGKQLLKNFLFLTS
jgi:anthranilate synthase/aminodeoxychorismate synthase-like glutamine amidotransferase